MQELCITQGGTTHGDLFLKTSMILTYHPQLRAYTHTNTYSLKIFFHPAPLFSSKTGYSTQTRACQSFPPLPDPQPSSFSLSLWNQSVNLALDAAMLALRLWDCCWLCSRLGTELKRHPKEKMLIKQKRTQGQHMVRHCCFIVGQLLLRPEVLLSRERQIQSEKDLEIVFLLH